RPGPELGPEGYRRLGERHGLALDPERYEPARLAAIDTLKRHPELRHDDEIWIEFTEVIVRGMGGDADGARACAAEMTAAWGRPPPGVHAAARGSLRPPGRARASPLAQSARLRCARRAAAPPR